MILLFSKFLMNFYKNNENSAILKIIRIPKIATADLHQITKRSFEDIQFIEKCDTVYTHLFKDLKDLSPLLS